MEPAPAPLQCNNNWNRMRLLCCSLQGRSWAWPCSQLRTRVWPQSAFGTDRPQKREGESLCRRDRQCLSELTPCRLCHLHTRMSVWLAPSHECLCDLFWFLFNTQFKLVKGLITEVYFCVYLWLSTLKAMLFSLPPLLLVASWSFYVHMFN